MKLIKKCVLLIAIIGLSGCSLFAAEKAPTRYTLSAMPYEVPINKSKRHTLLVFPPVAEPVFNTVKIAYSTAPYRIGYYSINQWAATPPQMMQPLLLQALQKTQHFRAVILPLSVGRYDYILNTRILNLVDDFTRCPAILHFVVRAQLVNANNGKVIATQTFSIDRPLKQQTPYGGVLAANAAMSEMLVKISRFCIQHIS